MSSPCQDCPYRKLRCHERCDEYLDWHDALVEAKSKVKAAFIAIDYLDEMARKRERKARSSKKTLTPIKAIRAKCLDCCCGQFQEVRLCSCKDCSLWPYRLGKRPKKDAGDITTLPETDTPKTPHVGGELKR